ncbi:DNA-binding protein [Candidatus Woesearchaeota archaeon]|nr:DNA-binding protein [Candidatus Woesearchaeota archaeon]
MKYAKGKIKRVFVVKFEHGDDLLKELQGLLEKEDIKRGVIHLIGALKNASIVLGPKKPVIPQEIHELSFNDGREVVGLATIFPENGKPKVHLHAGLGKGKKVLVGCIRSGTEVYIVIEAIILELDVNASRKMDEKTGFNLLEPK